MVQGVHHIALIVSSEESIAFYQKLGFDEYRRIKRKNDIVVLMSGYGVGLEIFVDVKHPPRSQPEPLGLRHLAMKVDDIEKLSRSLDIDTGGIVKDWLGARYCLIVDPDGNVIEFHE